MKIALGWKMLLSKNFIATEEDSMLGSKLKGQTGCAVRG
jgi:hypothetical protein